MFMNKYDNKASKEMLQICEKFQIEKVQTYFNDYHFRGDENISPFLMDKIEDELKSILVAREVLGELIKSPYRKTRGPPYTIFFNYILDAHILRL